MKRQFNVMPFGSDPTQRQLTALAELVTGQPDSVLLPVPADQVSQRAIIEQARIDDPVGSPGDDPIVLGVATTGSTGVPKIVLHSRRTLLASIDATHARIGGPGNWLLAMELTHIAGIQVVLRAARGNGALRLCPSGGAGLVSGFADAMEQLPGPRRYASMVPAQMARLMSTPRSLQALQQLDALLLGGAAADPELLAKASEAGIAVVTTYGMSETGGGCVYDGVPLDGMRAELDDAGRISLAGDAVAHGYRNPLPDDPFGGAVFRTNDVGEWDADGRLQVLGRIDDIINTGGKKVAPRTVEMAIRELPGVQDVIVVPAPDPRWGEAITALIVGAPWPVEQLRDALRERLAAHELPQRSITIDQIPLAGIGKPDRQACRRIAGSTPG